MNWTVLINLVLLVGFGVAAIQAVRADRADRTYRLAAYHLMHGPKDGCVECEDK